MSKIHVTWEEATQGELPRVCATCGDAATEWVERKLSAVRPGLLCVVRTRTTVLLPFCPRHRVASWNGWARVMAWSINAKGVTLGQVSPDFVDAVWDYREHPEDYRKVVDRRSAATADDDGVELVEDAAPAPRPRVRRGTESGRILYAILAPILVGVLVACGGFGLLIFNLLRSRTADGPTVSQEAGTVRTVSAVRQSPFRTETQITQIIAEKNLRNLRLFCNHVGG